MPYGNTHYKIDLKPKSEEKNRVSLEHCANEKKILSEWERLCEIVYFNWSNLSNKIINHNNVYYHNIMI